MLEVYVHVTPSNDCFTFGFGGRGSYYSAESNASKYIQIMIVHVQHMAMKIFITHTALTYNEHCTTTLINYVHLKL